TRGGALRLAADDLAQQAVTCDPGEQGSAAHDDTGQSSVPAATRVFHERKTQRERSLCGPRGTIVPGRYRSPAEGRVPAGTGVAVDQRGPAILLRVELWRRCEQREGHAAGRHRQALRDFLRLRAQEIRRLGQSANHASAASDGNRDRERWKTTEV